MNGKDILEVLLRAFSSLAILFLLTRLMGRKQVSQLTLFDYIIGISIGSIAAEITVNQDSPFFLGMLGMAVYAIIAFLISYLTCKSIVCRRFFTGKPLILIQHGKIMESCLRKVKLDINDLLSLCRNAGYFSPDEIEFAVFEANGQLSILPKTEKKPVTPQELFLQVPSAQIFAEVIIDGKIMEKNLYGIGKDKIWLQKQLKVQGVRASELLLVLCDERGTLKIFPKEKIQLMDIQE